MVTVTNHAVPINKEMSNMPPKLVLIQKENKIATLVLNRPEVLNAMNEDMLHQLHDAVMQIAADAEELATKLVISKELEKQLAEPAQKFKDQFVKTIET